MCSGAWVQGYYIKSKVQKKIMKKHGMDGCTYGNLHNSSTICFLAMFVDYTVAIQGFFVLL